MSKLELINGRLALSKWKNRKETFQLASDGCINLYSKNNILQESIDMLISENNEVFLFDAINWNTLDQFYSEFSNGMNFPDYFGNNLDAINDCLSDMIGKNIVICILNYDIFLSKFNYEANLLPQIILSQCWNSLLQDSSIIMLIQTSNRDISFSGINEFIPKWNRKEWLIK